MVVECRLSENCHCEERERRSNLKYGLNKGLMRSLRSLAMTRIAFVGRSVERYWNYGKKGTKSLTFPQNRISISRLLSASMGAVKSLLRLYY